MIKKEDRNLGARAYEAPHIAKVATEIEKNFPSFFLDFLKHYTNPNPFEGNANFKVVVSKKNNVASKLSGVFEKNIENLEKERPSYEKLFDLESLEEDQDDPNAFKTALSKRISIINRCLNSKAEEMQRYQVEFWNKPGREMLNVTTAIISFGNQHSAGFNATAHESSLTVEALGISALLEDQYVAYNVIGGGIKSNFLHTLFPHAFPYRSQNALWALWYLTSKKDFNFTDGSEFLMIDPQKGTTQQNYHYPYDLFCFYALKIYLLLKNACLEQGIDLQQQYRYIYLDIFLNYIADKEKLEISDLKKSGDYAG